MTEIIEIIGYIIAILMLLIVSGGVMLGWSDVIKDWIIGRKD